MRDVYIVGGFLFTKESQMPHVFPNVRNLESKPVVGDGSCVTLIKQLAPGLVGVPTTRWKAGKNVVGSTGIVPGTAIATFVDGKYPRKSTGNHAAFFLAYGGAGIWVVDQWADPKRTTIGRRFIAPKAPGNNGVYSMPSNSAGAYYVIETQ